MSSTKNIKKSIAVLGAGSWGGTLTWLISNKNEKVTLWTFSKDEYKVIKKTKALLRPKNLKLNKNVYITTDLSEAIQNSSVIIIAVPTNAFEPVVLKLKELKLSKKTVLLSATKGITNDKYLRPSQILKKHFPQNPIAVLSGPNIALDVISETPTISVIATKNKNIGLMLQSLVSTKHFRIYLNDDINGIEIAGALKNVIAIAGGISDGLGFSMSTKSALISRGLMEIARINKYEGGKHSTLLSAAGVGDLIATCCSVNSRNYRVGFELAKGKKLNQILKELGQVAEGTETVKAMVNLGKKYKLNLPIANAVYNVIYKNKTPLSELNSLLTRPLPEYEISL